MSTAMRTRGAETAAKPPAAGVAMSYLRALAGHARSRPDKIAIADDHGTATYGELWTSISRVAAWLQNRGIGPGDQVVTALKPTIPHFVVLMAAMRAGGVAAPLNTRLTVGEAERYLARLDPALVVAENEFGTLLDTVADVVFEPANLEAPSDLRQRLGDLDSDVATSAWNIDEEAAALIVGTGGTTGLPKGAALSHRALWSWSSSAAAHQHIRADSVDLTATPFFHSFLISGLMTVLFCGGTVRLLPRFDPDQALDVIRKHGVTRMSVPPTVLVAMAELIRRSKDRPAVSSIMFGSSDPPPGFLQLARGCFPEAEFMTGYGTTEFGPVARVYLENERELTPGLIGRDVPGAEITIVGPDGVQCGSGDEGEIIVRAPWQMSGYWGLPAETRAVMSDEGAIHSGDLGCRAEDGSLYLRGRLKEMISSGGENVFPAEVEEVLSKHEAIAEIAVFGVSDGYWGERVEVAVVLRPGASLTLEDVREYGRNHLAGYKLPKRLRILHQLPRTSNQKLDRRELRQQSEALED